MRNDKPWVIVGAGPVGAMQTALFAALFPDQKIHVLDKRHTNIRGHGLKIRNSTINKIVNQLKEVKKLAQESINAGKEVDYYKTVIANIDLTIPFLEKNFKGFFGSTFIRTYRISQLLREHVEKLTKQNSANVEFHLEAEVTADDLKQLTSDNVSNVTEDLKQLDYLQQASAIFGADGAHSVVRTEIFKEKVPENSEMIDYLIEVKLDMRSKENFIWDKISKSILPTLKKGGWHFWNRGRDGTATLHIFVNDNTYKLLRTQDQSGKEKGTHANPYRRLADFPARLQGPLKDTIINVIGTDELKADSLKVTAIPLQVYLAQQLMRNENGRFIALVGDSAAGLVLENGVNVGIQCAMEYADAFFQADLSKDNLKMSEDGIPLPLEECRLNIIKLVKQTIDSIRFTNRSMHSLKGSRRSPFHIYDDEVPRVRLSNSLWEQFDSLKGSIPNFDYNTQLIEHNKYANWLLHLDCICAELESDIFRLYEKESPELEEFIRQTQDYINIIIDSKIKSEDKLKIIVEYRDFNNKFCRSLKGWSNFVKAGDDLYNYEVAFENFNSKLNDYKTQKGDTDVSAALQNLADAIIKVAPSPSEIAYKNVMNTFASITDQLVRNPKLSINDLTRELTQLDNSLYGLPPFNNSYVKMAIGMAIGAIVGFILGVTVGAAITWYAGGMGAIPAAIVATIKGAELGASLALGGITLAGLVTGTTLGFFNSKRTQNNYVAHCNKVNDDLKIADELSQVKTVLLQP